MSFNSLNKKEMGGWCIIESLCYLLQQNIISHNLFLGVLKCVQFNVVCLISQVRPSFEPDEFRISERIQKRCKSWLDYSEHVFNAKNLV